MVIYEKRIEYGKEVSTGKVVGSYVNRTFQEDTDGKNWDHIWMSISDSDIKPFNIRFINAGYKVLNEFDSNGFCFVDRVDKTVRYCTYDNMVYGNEICRLEQFTNYKLEGLEGL